MGEINLGNFYEFNKEQYNNQRQLDPVFANRKFVEIGDWMRKFKYVMLLCRERYDFTIFNFNSDGEEDAGDVLKECVLNRGEVLDMIYQENTGAYEIWIRDIIENESYVYYLFDYSGGVLEVE